MAPKAKECATFSSIPDWAARKGDPRTTSSSTTADWRLMKQSAILLALCAQVNSKATQEDIKAFATDCEAHVRWKLGTDGTDIDLMGKFGRASAEALKKWKEQRALLQLERKAKAVGDLVQSIRDERQEPAVKRKREDELIEEIDGLTSMAKKLKQERAKAT
jgi:hypothetical protein